MNKNKKIVIEVLPLKDTSIKIFEDLEAEGISIEELNLGKNPPRIYIALEIPEELSQLTEVFTKPGDMENIF